MAHCRSDMDQQVRKFIQACLGSTAEDTCEGLDYALEVLKLAKRELDSRKEKLLTPENRSVPIECAVARYCLERPANSIIPILERVEKTFSSKQWPTEKSIENLFTSHTQFAGLDQYCLPVQRVVVTGLSFGSRSDNISRIRNVFIADAIDTHINNTGSVRSNLKQALKQLALNLHSDQVDSLIRWRRAGEWLLALFQHIPLGAIYMMGKQTSLWGNNIGIGYVDPVVKYCRSLPDFISHSQKLTPAACRAIRYWAEGCTYGWSPDSSLVELVEMQEKAYPPKDAAEPRSLVPIRLGAARHAYHDETETLLEYNTYGMDLLAAQDSSRLSLGTNNESINSIMMFPSQGDEGDSGFNHRAGPANMLYAPSPPQTLSIPESLFHDIKVYFESSSRKMVFDANEVLLCPDHTEFRNTLCTSFDSYCFTATMLGEKGLSDEFALTLGKAFNLVESVLQVNHPRTLACFFEVMIHLIQNGLTEVALQLRNFIKAMSAQIRGRKDIPSRIYQLLDKVDQTHLTHVMAEGWRCATKVFDDVLGPSHRLAVSVRLDYVKRVTITNHPEEERLLRDLLFRFEGAPGHATPRVMFNLAHNLNRQGRHNEAEMIALEVSTMLQQCQIYAGRDSETIESLKILSHSRFLQGKASEAERTIREAIDLIGDQWGEKHPWALEFMNVLESWLRYWGRGDDADVLRRKIATFVGPFG